MKKLWSIMLTFALVLCLFPATVQAENEGKIRIYFEDFTQGQVKISVDSEVIGAYTANWEGIEDIAPGSTVNVEVTSKPGYRLKNYQRDGDIIMTDSKNLPSDLLMPTPGTYSFKMPSTEGVIISPKFEEAYSNLIIGSNPDLQNGKVEVKIGSNTTVYTSENTPATVSVRADSNVSVKITPDHGHKTKYKNIIWVDAGKIDPPGFADQGGGSYSFTMPNGSAAQTVDISPAFETASKYTITSGEFDHGTIIAQETEAYSGDTIHVKVNVDEGYILNYASYKFFLDEYEDELIPLDENGEGTFEMPSANVELNLSYTLNQYNVKVDDEIENGSLQALRWNHKPTTWSYYNDNVFIKATPDAGYDLRSLTVTDQNGATIKTTLCDDHEDEYTFKMPSSDVDVTAEFGIPYEISLIEGPVVGGQIEFPKKAFEGDTVTLTATPDVGYGVSVLEYEYRLEGDTYGSIRQPVPEGEGAYTFTMPASNVGIRCKFGEEHTLIVDVCEGHEEIAQALSDQVGIPATGYQIEEINGTQITMNLYGSSNFEVRELVTRPLIEAIVELGINMDDQIHNSERLFNSSIMLGSKPLQDYENEAAFIADLNSDEMPADGSIMYILWEKPVENVQVTIEAPKCGTEVTFVRGYEFSGGTAYSNPSPVITVEGDAKVYKNIFHNNKDGFWTDNEQGAWVNDPDGIGFFTGMMKGEKEYLVCFQIEGNFGYFFSDATKNAITVNGEAPLYVSKNVVVSKIKAEHIISDDAVVEDPTCEEAGSRTYHCTGCNEDVIEEIPALGHDWSDWEVTKEATEEAEGEKMRTCSRCGETETRSIDKLDPADPTDPDDATDPTDQTDPDDATDPTDPADISYRNTEGDGTKWTKGSAETADFTFKRSENDSVTFTHFTGIQVDGKDVDQVNYTAGSGSVIVKLKPAYLETLSVGEHTLTALFDDGNSASAKFTILAKSTNSPTSSGTAKKANDVNTSTTAPKTGDTGNMLLWLTVLCASMLVLFVAISVCRRNTIGRR